MLASLASPSITFLYFSGDNQLPVAAKSGYGSSFFLPRRTRFMAALHAFADPVPFMAEIPRPSSLYEVLGVNKNASAVEIKSAYRSLAKLYHPDSSKSSDGEDFILIHKAYATLSDPSLRTLYDRSLGALGGRRQFQYTGYTGYYTTRRWETDQCW